MNSELFNPLSLARGPKLSNRLLLAPLTSEQSHADGVLSEADMRWIENCSRNGYSMIMTGAANVQENGKTFKGQPGIYHDRHLPGLQRMADIIRSHGSVSSVQLHHGGMRAGIAGFTPAGQIVGPSENETYGARALTLSEVEQLRDDFILAALRAEKAGFDGAEVHGAFGWILSQFLSPELNKREDCYGGDTENRARLIFEIIDGIRSACKPGFQIGLRLSFERYGMRFEDILYVSERAIREGNIDYLDLAPWDVKKMMGDGQYAEKSALELFTSIPRGAVKIGASGKIMSAKDAESVMSAGLDFVMIGRAAVLQNDFPEQVRKNPGYVTPPLPVTSGYLKKQGLSENFIDYMRKWDGFVAD